VTFIESVGPDELFSAGRVDSRATSEDGVVAARDGFGLEGDLQAS
jgi:hypothetical protein